MKQSTLLEDMKDFFAEHKEVLEDFLKIYEYELDENGEIIEKEEQQRIAKEPIVTFKWSEHNEIKEDTKMPISIADDYLRRLNKVCEKTFGYYKTSYEIDFELDGIESSYQGRYDIGSEKGGLIDAIENYLTQDTFVNLEVEQKEFWLEKAIPYFRSFDINEHFKGNKESLFEKANDEQEISKDTSIER